MKKIVLIALIIIPFLVHAQEINYTDGNCVSGDCQNGRGVYVFNNGDTYSGDFSNGKFNGQGKYTYKNGATYEGFYANHKKNGTGTYTYPQSSNKLKYVGDFSGGMFNGKGNLTYKDGYIFNGEWKDNKAQIGSLQGVPAFWDANDTVTIGDTKYDVSNQMQRIAGPYPGSVYYSITDGNNNHGMIFFEKSAMGYSAQKTLKVYLKAKDCSNDVAILDALITENPRPGKVVECVNAACEPALREHLTNHPLDLFKIIVSQSTIIESSEEAILRIMHCLDTTHYAEFFDYLENQNNDVIKKLVAKLNDKTIRLFGGDNYTGFIKELIKMYQKVPAYWIPRVPKVGDGKLLGQFINLYPKPFVSDMASSSSMFEVSIPFNEFRFVGDYNEDDGTITIRRQQKIHNERRYGDDVSIQEHWIPDKEPLAANLKPLDPIVILTDKELPVVKTALEGGQTQNDTYNNAYIVPAIFLAYKNTKDLNQALLDAAVNTINIAVDVAGIVSGTGEIIEAANLIGKAKYIKRFWAVSEIIGGMGDIASTTNMIKNEKVKDAINLYNALLLIRPAYGYSISFANLENEVSPAFKEYIKDNKSLYNLILNNYSAWSNVFAGNGDNNIEKKDLGNGNAVVINELKKENPAVINELKKEYAVFLASGVVNKSDEKRINGLFSAIDDAQNNSAEPKKQMETHDSSKQSQSIKQAVEVAKPSQTPSALQTIPISTPTTLTSASTGEQFEAQPGDTIVAGEMKDGKIIQGRVIRNGEPVKIFLNKRNF